jgi:hypothetical protein
MQDQKVMKQMVEQFFYAASPPGSPQYDPTTQWNQVTLTCTILGCIWHEISTFERACILEYTRKIQINPTNKYPKRQQKYIHFLQQVCEQHGSENREAETGVECTGTNNCHSQRTRYTKSAWLKRKKKP